MRIEILPQLTDNYAYLIDGPGGLVVVDPAEPEAVLAAVRRAGRSLVAVLSTHHHGDHVGGNLALAAAVPGLTIVGYAGDDRIPGKTLGVRDRERFVVGGLEVEARFVPCHTSGHLAYRIGADLFTGDTLFSAGCGRFFEGTAAEMAHALFEVLGALPDETRVYPGHEYTVKNLEFADWLTPDDPGLAAKLSACRALRAAGRPTVPSTLAEERRINPFLRAREPSIRRAVEGRLPALVGASDVEILGGVRALKDGF